MTSNHFTVMGVTRECPQLSTSSQPWGLDLIKTTLKTVLSSHSQENPYLESSKLQWYLSAK